MGRLSVVLLLALTGCIEPTLTFCGNIACSGAQVCDGQGGCALPAQLTVCMSTEPGAECGYEDLTGTCVEGFVTADEVCDDRSGSRRSSHRQTRRAATARSMRRAGSSATTATPMTVMRVNRPASSRAVATA